MEYGERQQKRRFVVLTAIFSGAIGVLALYLFWLQIVKGRGVHPARARRLRARDAPHRAARGDLRPARRRSAGVQRGFLLRGRRPRRGARLRSFPALFSRLARALSIPVEDIEQKVPPKSWRQFQPIEMKGGVTLQTMSAIAERRRISRA